MSQRPFAEYHLVQGRADLEVDFHDGSTFAVLRGKAVDVGRTPDSDITVRFSPTPDFRGWGGRRNHRLSWTAEAGWQLAHLGHQGNILVDGVELVGHARVVPLRHGSRVMPTEELVFEFRLRPDLEALWSELVGAAFPASGKLEVLHDALLERRELDEAGVAVALRHFRGRVTPA